MKAGDKVICIASRGYDFTTGKTYEVVKFEPAYSDRETPAGFTWPAYVQVMDNCGKLVHAHASRFILKKEEA